MTHYCALCQRWIEPMEEKEIIGVKCYHARCADRLREEHKTKGKKESRVGH